MANKRNYDIIEFEDVLEFKLDDFEIVFIKDDMLGEGSYYSISSEEDSINIFLNGFPASGNYDVAIFDNFINENLVNASYNDVYFKESSLTDSSYDGYVDTFSNRIRILFKDGENERQIYEP